MQGGSMRQNYKTTNEDRQGAGDPMGNRKWQVSNMGRAFHTPHWQCVALSHQQGLIPPAPAALTV